MSTGFFGDERCFWHSGGNYASMLPVGGLVQPMVNGGVPETPESKRRLRNLLDITGLAQDLKMQSAPFADRAALERVHPAAFLDRFKAMSDAGGGEIGVRCPFGPGGFEIAAQSAGLATGALDAVLRGKLDNAYAPLMFSRFPFIRRGISRPIQARSRTEALARGRGTI